MCRRLIWSTGHGTVVQISLAAPWRARAPNKCVCPRPRLLSYIDEGYCGGTMTPNPIFRRIIESTVALHVFAIVTIEILLSIKGLGSSFHQQLVLL